MCAKVQECNKCVKLVSQKCYKGVTNVKQGCKKCVTREGACKLLKIIQKTENGSEGR